MATKTPSHRKALLGDDETSLRGVLNQVVEEIGGKAELAKHLAKYLKDEKANPYLQSRAMQTVIRMLDRTERQAGDSPILTDEELEEVVVKDMVRFLVTMPAEVFDPFLLKIQERRTQLREAEEAARETLIVANRPIAEPSPLAG